MDPAVLKVFGVLMAILIPLALGAGVYVWITSFVRRPKVSSSGSANTPEQVGRSDTLERIQSELQQLEERVDFMERVLPALREGKALPETPPRSR
jgi:hypothetical protein